MNEEEMLDILEKYFEIIKDIPLIECGDIAMILATKEMLERYKKQQKEIEKLKKKIEEIYNDFENNKPVIAICKLKKIMEE